MSRYVEIRVFHVLLKYSVGFLTKTGTVRNVRFNYPEKEFHLLGYNTVQVSRKSTDFSVEHVASIFRNKSELCIFMA
jgi:hypothetical protein